MLGTGKYNFPGIRNAGVKAINALLSATQWGAAIVASPFRPLYELVIKWIAEWAANKGLIFINLAAIVVNGEIDQNRLDSAMDIALEKIKIPGLSDKEKEVIDEPVRNAFRKFARLNSKPK